MHKPYQTIDEQIAILRSRRVATTEETAYILRREGYYAVVNGYKDLFLDSGCSDREERYIPGTEFNQLYMLFKFDRRLRELLFKAILQAEATFKTTCAQEFTKVHANQINPYLDANNYENPSEAGNLTAVFNKILHPRDPSRIKNYIRHYLDSFGGEVPLWVLSNDLTLGQTLWFYQKIPDDVRRSISDGFSLLYESTHDRPRRITTVRLEKIYMRLAYFRNICAHDERLYCSHRDGRINESVYQAIQDLGYVMDSNKYSLLLIEVGKLLHRLRRQLPNQYADVCRFAGIDDIEKPLSKLMDMFEVRQRCSPPRRWFVESLRNNYLS
ncbi:Abi family protein [Bifidobacterium simiarum]|uniref:Abi family protein n=1 Tax=Bifidobacterium simiarum TaxID=2045441 RepID=UPI001BDC56DA|nr:Abi family protein [Bifidobacterium simiarum]MBT1166843.1 Abi family protein [Bifidobacterium simiarum]